MKVADTIIEQIGKKAFFMMGAKRFVAIEDGLQFKVGRNAKQVNLVEIKLNASDLYDVRFMWLTKRGVKVKSEYSDVYVDNLHAVLREGTGMDTTVPNVRRVR